MALVTPSGPEAVVQEAPGGLEVVIPARRNLFITALLGFWLCGWLMGDVALPIARAAGPSARGKGAIPERAWSTTCGDGRCLMVVTVPFDRGRGTEEAALAVSMDQREKTLQYVSVYVPPDAAVAAGLLIAFLDAARDDGSKRRPTGDLYSIPIVECTKAHCVSRVFPELDNRDGTSLDLMTELKRRDYLWVLFTRRADSEPVRVLIPVRRFGDELDKLRRSGST